MYSQGPFHPPSPPDTLHNIYSQRSFASIRNVLPYTHHSRDSSRTLDRDRGRSRWLVVVKPEDAIATVLIRSGLSDASGLLLMLQQTMTLQLLSLLSHFSLLSPSGLSLHLSLPDGSSSRITEEAWPVLFASHLAMEPAVVPIAATLTLHVEQSRARWFHSWALNPRAGLEGVLSGAKVIERLALQEKGADLLQPVAPGNPSDAHTKVAEWQQSTRPQQAVPISDGPTEESIPIEGDYDSAASPYNPADYTYSISSFGPTSPLPSAPLSYKHFTPHTPDVGRRNEGSVCLTPSTATSWGPITENWDVTSPARLSSVDLGERAASPGDGARGQGRGPRWWHTDHEDLQEHELRSRASVHTHAEPVKHASHLLNQSDREIWSEEDTNDSDSSSPPPIPQPAGHALLPHRTSLSGRRRGSPPLGIMVPVLRKVAAIQVSDPILTTPPPQFEDVDLVSSRPMSGLCPIDVCQTWSDGDKPRDRLPSTSNLTAGTDILVSEDATEIEVPLASSSTLHTLGVRYREGAPSPEATGVSNPFDFPLTPDTSLRRPSISSTSSGSSQDSAPKRPVKTVLRAVGNFSEGAELEKPLNSPPLRKISAQSLEDLHDAYDSAERRPSYITPFYHYPRMIVYAPLANEDNATLIVDAPRGTIHCLPGPPIPWPKLEICPRKASGTSGRYVKVLLISPKPWPLLEIYPPLHGPVGTQGAHVSSPAPVAAHANIKVLLAAPLPWPRLVIYPITRLSPICVMLPSARPYPFLDIYPTRKQAIQTPRAVMLQGSTTYPDFSIYPPVWRGQPRSVSIMLPGSTAYPLLEIYPRSKVAAPLKLDTEVGDVVPKLVPVNLTAPLPYPILVIYPVLREARPTVQHTTMSEEQLILPLRSTPIVSRPPPFSSSPFHTNSDEESSARRQPVRNSVIGLSVKGRLAASPQGRAMSGPGSAPTTRSRSGTLISERAAFFSRPESTGSPPKTTGRLDKATLGRWV